MSALSAKPPRARGACPHLAALLLAASLGGCGLFSGDAPPPPAPPTADQDYANGLAARQHGDYEPAVRWFTAAAELNDNRARVALGALFIAGRGVDQSFAEAEHWLMPAAEAGVAEAQLRLGFIYEVGGTGITRNPGKALGWYIRAADQGNAHAQYRAGLLYLAGAVPGDHNAEAARLFRLAAAQSLPQALTGLGTLYMQGRGVPQDIRESLRWFNRGAEAGDPDAMTQLGQAYWQGTGVAKNIPEGTKWMQRAADLGSEDAKRQLELPPQ